MKPEPVNIKINNLEYWIVGLARGVFAVFEVLIVLDLRKKFLERE